MKIHPSVSLIQHHHAVELMLIKKHTSASTVYIYIYIHYIIKDISYPNPHIQSIVNNPREKNAPRNTCQGSQSIAATWGEFMGDLVAKITFELMISLFHPCPVGYVSSLKTSLNLM